MARASSRTAVWLRRLYLAPRSSDLVALDARRRKVPTGLADFIRDRDRLCRTPWCGAPIRHVDPVTDAESPELTPGRAERWVGLCTSCHRSREAIDWLSRPRPGLWPDVEIVTPTGHVYVSYVPPPLAGDDDHAA